MGDLKYFIKNCPVGIWIALAFVILFFWFFFFKFIKNKIHAVVTMLLFVGSVVLFISFVGLHPFLCFGLLVIWFFILVIIAIQAQTTEQRQALYESVKRRDKQKQQAKLAKSRVICPYCGSKNVNFMQNNKKAFSTGKAVAGGILTGGIGLLAGFAGKKGQNEFFCRDCNRTFQHK